MAVTLRTLAPAALLACSVFAVADAADATATATAGRAAAEIPAADAQPALAPADALALIDGEAPPLVLDVRTPEEFADGRIPGAVLIPHDQLAARLGELDRDRPVLVYCRSGRRATEAEAVLRHEGFDVRQIDGSWLEWQAQGLRVEDAAPAAEDGR